MRPTGALQAASRYQVTFLGATTNMSSFLGCAPVPQRVCVGGADAHTGCGVCCVCAPRVRVECESPGERESECDPTLCEKENKTIARSRRESRDSRLGCCSRLSADGHVTHARTVTWAGTAHWTRLSDTRLLSGSPRRMAEAMAGRKILIGHLGNKLRREQRAQHGQWIRVDV